MTKAVEVVKCQDPKRLAPFKVFAFFGLLHWLSGLIFIVIGLIIYWTYAIIPAIWFCIGFLWVNAAHLMVADYRYEYDDGSLIIKKIKFGRTKTLAKLDLAECTFDVDTKADYVTTERPNLWVNGPNKHYALTASPYFAALCKGELDVS